MSSCSIKVFSKQNDKYIISENKRVNQIVYVNTNMMSSDCSNNNCNAITPFDIQQKMGLGINLGNRLDLYQQPDREVKQDFINDYANKGFKNIRIPVCWDGHTGSTAPYTIDSTFLNKVKQIVDWSLKKGMITIINTHHEKWLDEAGPSFLNKLPRLEAIWKQIADTFVGYSEMLLFEIFNEPKNMTIDQLNKMNSSVIPIIRTKHKTRLILLMGLQFGNPTWIVSNPKSLIIPQDKYIMLEIHNYDPYNYTNPKPTKFQWGSDQDIQALYKWSNDIDKWSKQNNILIYYGEFGCSNSQNANTGMYKWFKYHADVIKSKGWGASVWNDGGQHLIYNYTTEKWDENIIAALGINK